MNDKTVEPNSELNKLDTNGDNVISQEEYEQSERRIRLELLKNEDQKTRPATTDDLVQSDFTCLFFRFC